ADPAGAVFASAGAALAAAGLRCSPQANVNSQARANSTVAKAHGRTGSCTKGIRNRPPRSASVEGRTAGAVGDAGGADAPARPGATSRCSGGTDATFAAAASTSHHATRGPATSSVPASAGTI